MGSRFTIGLIYSINENWIAGTYYIDNLVSALNSLPIEQQPFLKIYCDNLEDYNSLIKKTKYPKISLVLLKNKIPLIGKLINWFSYRIFKKHLVTNRIDTEVDLIFPNPYSYHFQNIKKKLYWIPDFQEKHYPYFFTKKQLTFRKENHNKLVKKRQPIVFSSEDAKKDFYQIYPNAKNLVFVMPFMVTLPDLAGIQHMQLLEKYKIHTDFFICSNQFWAHKNHEVILRALIYLKEKGLVAKVLFTGKPHDDRNPHYYSSLLQIVKENNLDDLVSFLGFIPRIDQLILMKNSIAILQPSLFEGWSTVVEDAKALEHPIIASDIAVHREQLPNTMGLFQPLDHKELANKMELALHGKLENREFYYSKNRMTFANNFLKIIESMI